ncbi:MAG: hypothetical protein ACLRSW_08015 [Christensenellaceae bacterium]
MIVGFSCGRGLICAIEQGSVTGWLIAILVVEAVATLFYIFFQENIS